MRLRSFQDKYLGDAPFWRFTLRLALPIAIQNFLSTSFALIDNLMVGMIDANSDIPLAAVGMANQLSWLLYVVYYGMSSSVAVFVSQYWGARDMDGIRRTYGLGLVISVPFALIFTVTGFFWAEPVLRLFNSDPQIIELGVSYLRIAYFSYLAIAITQIFSAVLRSIEQVRLPMYVGLATAAVNVALSAFFIFGLRLGVRGAAMGTVITAWISPVALFVISLKKRNVLISSIRAMCNWSRKYIALYVHRSWPIMMNEVFWAIGTLGFRLIYANLDAGFYAAMTICISMTDIAFVFFIGLCHACSVMVGKCVGAGDLERAVVEARRFAFLMPVLSAIVGLMVALARIPLMAAAGVSLTDATRVMAQGIMLVIGLELGLRHLPFVAVVGIFRAGGDTKAGLIYDTVCVLGIALPVTALCAYVLKLDLILVYAIMLLSEDAVKNVLCIRRFRSRKWLKPVTRREPSATAASLDGMA